MSMMSISKKRVVVAAAIASLFAFYVFNFVPRNINVLSTRPLARQIFAYVLNFALFFILAYLFLTLLAYLVRTISSK